MGYYAACITLNRTPVDHAAAGELFDQTPGPQDGFVEDVRVGGGPWFHARRPLRRNRRATRQRESRARPGRIPGRPMSQASGFNRGIFSSSRM